MSVYFTGIALTCAVLWAFRDFTWRKTGRSNAILRIELKAATFDALVAAAAGLRLGAVYLFRDGALAMVAPVGDSVIVLLLCLLAIGVHLRELRGGMGELAGISALAKHLAVARRSDKPGAVQSLRWLDELHGAYRDHHNRYSGSWVRPFSVPIWPKRYLNPSNLR